MVTNLTEGSFFFSSRPPARVRREWKQNKNVSPEGSFMNYVTRVTKEGVVNIWGNRRDASVTLEIKGALNRPWTQRDITHADLVPL